MGPCRGVRHDNYIIKELMAFKLLLVGGSDPFPYSLEWRLGYLPSKDLNYVLQLFTNFNILPLEGVSFVVNFINWYRYLEVMLP